MFGVVERNEFLEQEIRVGGLSKILAKNLEDIRESGFRVCPAKYVGEVRRFFFKMHVKFDCFVLRRDCSVNGCSRFDRFDLLAEISDPSLPRDKIVITVLHCGSHHRTKRDNSPPAK